MVLPLLILQKPVLTMTGSRGCPYRCDYCSLINTGGKVYRRRDPVKIADEYEYLVDRYKVKQIDLSIQFIRWSKKISSHL